MINIKKKIKAIIFDMDGTIVKTERIWDKVTQGTLAKYGINELSLEQQQFIETLVGMGLVDASHAIKEQFGLSDSAEDIFNLKVTLAASHFTSKLDYIEGFEKFHNKLVEHKIATSLATNAHPDHLDVIVKTMNFFNKFGNNIYCVKHVNNKAKPDPALFLHAAKQLNVDPSECVVFEDSIHGFNAAKAAGMICIAVKNENNKQLLDLVHDSIDSYHEAEDILRKLIKKK